MTSSRPPSLRELNRTLLARQLLLERRRVALRAAVRRLVALQAQAPFSPYVALWSRLDGFRKDQLNRAFHAGTVVKATSLRLTLHVADRGHFGDLASASIEARPGRFEATVRAAPLGPWPHNKPSPERDWEHPLPDPAEAAIRVVRAYLAAYGPATRQDVQKFTGFRLGQIDPALEGMRDLGGGLWDAPRAPRLTGDVPAPVRFLPAFDSILLAHRDRTRIVPAEYEEVVFNKANATVKNTFTVDGFVAGAWRIENGKLALDPFAPLPPKWRRKVEAEGERLRAWYLG